jgi:hypothetical protein
MYFSNGISFVGGYRSWDGNIPAKCSLVLKCLIKPIALGEWYFGVVISSNSTVVDVICRSLMVKEHGATTLHWADCDPAKITSQ